MSDNDLATPNPHPGGPPLRRPPDGVLGGVCAAVAEHLGCDVALVRLLAALLLVVTGGAAVLVYLAAWVLIPRCGARSTRPRAGVVGASAACSARATLTGLGERPRDPEVQEQDRRVVSVISTAVGAILTAPARREDDLTPPR